MKKEKQQTKPNALDIENVFQVELFPLFNI